MRPAVLTNCVLGLMILGPAVRGWADEIVPPRPVSPQDRILDGLVGTWDGQISGGSAESVGKPAPSGRITRQWVADRHFVQERGRDHLAFLTFDTRQGMYRAWYFHANGHVWELSGRWTGSSDRLSVSAELDENQSLTRNFQILDQKHHECTVTWTDEDGRTGIYGTFNYTRCNPGKKSSGQKSAAVSKPKSPPPPEMKIFADELGKWALQWSVTSGEKTNKVSGSSVVQSILGGQFLQTTATVQGRPGENFSIVGFDAATKTYRFWFFEADGAPLGPAAGTWDEKQRTMTWECQLAGNVVMSSKKQWLNRDTAKVHRVCSQRNGSVYSTMDGTMTRQTGKPEPKRK